MTNILTEKVKEIEQELLDDIYYREVSASTGGTKYFIALLEADVQRNKTQLYDQMANLVIGDKFTETMMYIEKEITYKQQAIDELKKLSN